jgi:Arginyl tRNA synthetase N terminal domain
MDVYGNFFTASHFMQTDYVERWQNIFLFIILQSILLENQQDSSSQVPAAPESAKGSSAHMVSLLKAVTSLFENAIRSAFPDVADQIQVAVSPAAQEKFGDYQCNSAMTIAQVNLTD